jgi:hypothetical protein
MMEATAKKCEMLYVEGVSEKEGRAGRGKGNGGGREERHEYPRQAKIDKSVVLSHIFVPLFLSNAGIFTHV